jgi:hypothetical protein
MQGRVLSLHTVNFKHPGMSDFSFSIYPLHHGMDRPLLVTCRDGRLKLYEVASPFQPGACQGFAVTEKPSFEKKLFLQIDCTSREEFCNRY